MAANTISILITAKDDASATLRKVEGEVSGSSERMSGVISKGAVVASAAIATLATATVAAGLAAAKAVNAYADYQQSLNVFRSVSGATAEQMTIVANTAKQLGKDITLPGVSAKDAALAMVGLSKAGLSVNDTLGAAKGVLSLAKAGQLAVADAASIAANALNAFGMKGDEATKVADILAGGANASSASVQDLSLALQQASSSASRFKVPLSDTVTALGLFANNGIQGSDAGTSLKTMFSNLIPTTDKQSKLMRQLGLDFFDTKGQFIGLRATAEQLQEKLHGLTDEQKQLAVETIFGSDASRAASVLAKEGGEGFDKLAAGVNRANAATSLAAAQNSGLKGAFENIKSIVETLAIDLGEKLAPAVQGVADLLANSLEPAARYAYDSIKLIFDSFAAGDAQTTASGLPAYLAAVAEAARQVWDVISAFLAPSLQSLWATIQTQLLPSMREWWQVFGPMTIEQLKILGAVILGSIVVALRIMIDALNAAIFVSSALSRAATAISDPFVSAATSIKNAFLGSFHGIASVYNSTIGKLKLDIPSWVPSVGGKKFAMPVIPAFAAGTNCAPGGLAMVGERGPELVELPRGSKVNTAAQTQRMSSGRASVSNVFNIYNQVDLDAAMREQGWRLARAV